MPTPGRSLPNQVTEETSRTTAIPEHEQTDLPFAAGRRPGLR